MNKKVIIALVISTIFYGGIGFAGYNYMSNNQAKNNEQEQLNDKPVVDEIEIDKSESETENEEIIEEEPINNEVVDDKPVFNKKPEIITKGVQEFFDNKNEVIYMGMAEYGYTIKQSSNIIKNGLNIIRYDGFMNDGYGGDPKLRAFSIIYSISDGEVTETIVNHDTAKNKPTDKLQSIIPNLTVLKAPLVANTTWEDKFIYQGKEYTAVSKITLVDNDEITVDTIVKGIVNYPEDTYKEKRVYKKGIGLYSFLNTIEKDMGIDEFGYRYQEPIKQ